MSSIEDLTRKISQAKTADECASLEANLQSLLTQVSTKKRKFEEEDQEAGLKYKGTKNAFICGCGNSFKEDGKYMGACEDCRAKFCIECLSKCDDCDKTICNNNEGERDEDDPCGVLCPGCETAMLCKDCCKACDHCEEKKFCEDCLKDTSAPFTNMVCPDCFDNIKYCNR